MDKRHMSELPSSVRRATRRESKTGSASWTVDCFTVSMASRVVTSPGAVTGSWELGPPRLRTLGNWPTSG